MSAPVFPKEVSIQDFTAELRKVPASAFLSSKLAVLDRKRTPNLVRFSSVTGESQVWAANDLARIVRRRLFGNAAPIVRPVNPDPATIPGVTTGKQFGQRPPANISEYRDIVRRGLRRQRNR